MNIQRFLPAAACIISAHAAYAADPSFPSRPVRVVIPYAPGGGTDILVRTLQPIISANMGQQLIIDNRPGGATLIGTGIVAKATPDGYTVLATDTAFVINPALFKSLPYDTLKDFKGLTMMATAPVILLVHPSVQAKTVKELVALAKAKPGSLNFASGGAGTGPHLAGELLKLAAQIDITHVPYKGTGPALSDLLAGQVQLLFGGISSGKQHMEAGRVRALAVTGPVRNPATPDVPTFDEAGLTGIDADSYWGVYAAAGTPSSIVKYLNEQFLRALRAPATAERLAGLGFAPIANTPDEHTAQMRRMVARWMDVIQRANIKLEQ